MQEEYEWRNREAEGSTAAGAKKKKKRSSPNQLAELDNFATRGTENLKLG